MVSVFFADTDHAKDRQTSTMNSIILVSPCGDCETMQASSAYSMLNTARLTWSIAGSGLIDVGGFFRCTSSARMAVSSLNLWRTMVSTAVKKMLNNSGDSTHSWRSPCSSSNQSEQTPSSGRTQAIIPSGNRWMTGIICGGAPTRVSTCHRRVGSTVSYAFWRFMKHMKKDTSAFRPISWSLRTTNIMSVVEPSG